MDKSHRYGSSIKDVATVRAYHLDRIERFGSASTESLGWKSKDSQLRRFDQLARLKGIAGRSVLDVGCGHADLYSYLTAKHGDFDYTGIDNNESFLRVAAQRFQDNPSVRLLYGEFGSLVLPRADFVICCGALNYQNSDSMFVLRMINRLVDAARIGVGLSFLRRVDHENGILKASDPDQILKHCKKLSASVFLRQTDGDDFFTILIYR